MDKQDRDKLITFISSLKQNDFTNHFIEYISSYGRNGNIVPGVYVKSKKGRIGIVKKIEYGAPINENNTLIVKWGVSSKISCIRIKDIVVLEDYCGQLTEPEVGDTIYCFSGDHGIYVGDDEFSYIKDLKDFSMQNSSLYTKGFWVKDGIYEDEYGQKYDMCTTIYESDVVKVVKN